MSTASSRNVTSLSPLRLALGRAIEDGDARDSAEAVLPAPRSAALPGVDRVQRSFWTGAGDTPRGGSAGLATVFSLATFRSAVPR